MNILQGLQWICDLFNTVWPDIYKYKNSQAALTPKTLQSNGICVCIWLWCTIVLLVWLSFQRSGRFLDASFRSMNSPFFQGLYRELQYDFSQVFFVKLFGATNMNLVKNSWNYHDWYQQVMSDSSLWLHCLIRLLIVWLMENYWNLKS